MDSFGKQGQSSRVVITLFICQTSKLLVVVHRCPPLCHCLPPTPWLPLSCVFQIFAAAVAVHMEHGPGPGPERQAQLPRPEAPSGRQPLPSGPNAALLQPPVRCRCWGPVLGLLVCVCVCLARLRPAPGIQLSTPAARARQAVNPMERAVAPMRIPYLAIARTKKEAPGTDAGKPPQRTDSGAPTPAQRPRPSELMPGELRVGHLVYTNTGKFCKWHTIRVAVQRMVDAGGTGPVISGELRQLSRDWVTANWEVVPAAPQPFDILWHALTPSTHTLTLFAHALIPVLHKRSLRTSCATGFKMLHAGSHFLMK